MSSKIIVHHLNNSRSQRVLWLLEELELPYEIKHHTRTAEQRAPPELLAVNPLGKSPVIQDGDVTLAESGAIVEYIIEKYGKPTDKPTEAGKLDNLYYVHYSEGTLMPILVNKLVFSLIPSHAPFFIRPLLWLVFGQVDKQLTVPELKKNNALIDEHLKKTSGGWFAGGPSPTAADYMMLFPMEAMAVAGGDLVGSRLREWVEKVHGRPAYQRALEKGGKYSYA